MGKSGKLPPNTLLRQARLQRFSPSGSGRVLSRQELAEAVNAYLWRTHQIVERLDRSDVGKLERGEHRWPGTHRREAFRAVLDVETDAALGFYINRGQQEGSHPDTPVSWTPTAPAAVEKGTPTFEWLGPLAESQPAALPACGRRSTGTHPGGTALVARDLPDREAVALRLPAIRSVLDAHDLPADGPVRPIPVLQPVVADLIQLRLQSDYRTLAGMLPSLLSELHRAFQTHGGQRRTAVAALLAQAYRAADAVADKFSHYDLSARIIGHMRDAARESGDELVIAAAAYVRAETFFASGELRTGRRMLEQAADRLLPGSSTEATAAYGALHMRAGVLAARAGRPDTARDHLAEAHDCATRVEEGVYDGTVFGPASVRIHEVALAVDAGDPGAAIDAAADWAPPRELPAERRSHFYIEVARANTQAGRPGQALAALLTAGQIAPQHVRAHPHVHQMLNALTGDNVGGWPPTAPC